MTRKRWYPWTWPSELRKRGILGINHRNAAYILAANPRRHFPRVDDKLLTKRLCEQHELPVPQTLTVISRPGDVRRFPEMLGDCEQFVVKPARGSAGRGIIVIAGRQDHDWVTSSGEPISVADLRYEVSAILAGLYSLGGHHDQVIVEQRMLLHPLFQHVSVGGTPDIRIIVYRGVPAMAMLRLPTRASRGRGNLHQGALGTGIHLESGETLGGVYKGRVTEHHPDTGQGIVGLKIPQWENLLAAAMRLADTLELGYIGVDFVLDVHRGPVILEANGRPGLSIQIANRRGLLPRLEWIDHLPAIPASLDARCELVPQLAQI